MKEISACAHINMTNDQKHILKSHMSDHALEKLGFHTIVDLFPQHADELETLEMSTFVQLCHSSMCRFDLRTYDNDGIKFQSRPRAQHPLLPLHPQPPFPLLWQQTPLRLHIAAIGINHDRFASCYSHAHAENRHIGVIARAHVGIVLEPPNKEKTESKKIEYRKKARLSMYWHQMVKLPMLFLTAPGHMQ